MEVSWGVFVKFSEFYLQTQGEQHREVSPAPLCKVLTCLTWLLVPEKAFSFPEDPSWVSPINQYQDGRSGLRRSTDVYGNTPGAAHGCE